MKNKHPYPKKNKAFVLLISLLVSSVILASGLAVTRIIVRQIYLASVQRDSQLAFFAADAGLECARFWKDSGETIPSPPSNPQCNGVDLKNTSGGAVRDFDNDFEFYFNIGGQIYEKPGDLNAVAPKLCVKVKYTPAGVSGSPKARIESRGYNTECLSNGQLSGGRVVERKLVYQYTTN